MCGINGILRLADSAPPVDGDELLRTRDAMTARGPDGCGAWIANDGRVGLASRRLAFDISATQTNQVGRMQGWLTLWGLPISGGEVMSWMGGAHGGHSTSMAGMDMGSDVLMPGMATEEELANLRALSGPAFDVEFLRLMIRHHQGGKNMAEYAAAHAQVGAVRDLARTIAEAQTAEVTTMERMLSARGGTPLPAP